MTILTELARLYERMADQGEAPRPGFSVEKISFSVVLNGEGQVVRLADKRSKAGRKPAPVPMAVPAAVKRSSGIKPNLFWDKSAYVLGVTAVESETDGESRIIAGEGKRTAAEHAAFVSTHLELVPNTTQPGLVAFRRFLESWKPENFAQRGFDTEALDQNLVFELDEEQRFLHDLSAVPDLVVSPNDGPASRCLVSGQDGRAARLHPSIKGVMGAQSSGASLVAFNADAYESFGKSQGDNAPVSEAAAFAYGTALNALLARREDRALERHLRVGDTTVVFWAEAASHEAASWTEEMVGQAISPPDDTDEVNQLRAAIENVAQGRAGADPRLAADTKVFLLGLAPNAARLSVRLWHPGTFGDFARNLARFWSDLEIAPAPWKGPPAAWSLLYETALQRKAENIPPLLGGAVMRSVLNGQPLPRTLLSATIGRVRTDGDLSGRRAAICKAVINRTTKEEIPVSLDPNSDNLAYNLGRLFAAYTYAEKSYAERGATLRDKYLSGASANPARVFPLLMRGYEHNRSGLLKAADQRRGSGIKADRAVAQILESLNGAQDLPASLNMDEQGRFFVGFYHQWNAFFEKVEAAADAAAKEVVEENQ